MYRVRLYLGFGTVWATDNEQPDGDIRYFGTLSSAEQYGKSKNVPYEAVKVAPWGEYNH